MKGQFSILLASVWPRQYWTCIKLHAYSLLLCVHYMPYANHVKAGPAALNEKGHTCECVCAHDVQATGGHANLQIRYFLKTLSRQVKPCILILLHSVLLLLVCIFLFFWKWSVPDLSFHFCIIKDGLRCWCSGIHNNTSLLIQSPRCLSVRRPDFWW